MVKYRKILEAEGFKHVYEWTDKPNTKYPPHAHKGKVAFYVLKGSITMKLEGKTITLNPVDRMDVPVGVEHTATVGPQGCMYIVGEEIEGDS
jgi:quercetin dioxygenase-like cupin family protein